MCGMWLYHATIASEPTFLSFISFPDNLIHRLYNLRKVIADTLRDFTWFVTTEKYVALMLCSGEWSNFQSDWRLTTDRCPPWAFPIFVRQVLWGLDLLPKPYPQRDWTQVQSILYSSGPWNLALNFRILLIACFIQICRLWILLLQSIGFLIGKSCRLASCGGDKQIFNWDVATGKIIRKFRGHDGIVNSVTPHPPFSLMEMPPETQSGMAVAQKR